MAISESRIRRIIREETRRALQEIPPSGHFCLRRYI
jgi:hypothetical protein